METQPRHSSLQHRTPDRQSGASAVEFAFVLPLLLALTYSLFVYSYVYVVYESINYAAQQAAEAAVAVDPFDEENYQANVENYARATAAGALSWLPASQRTAAIGANGSAIQVYPCSPGGNGGEYCPAGVTGGTPVVVKIQFPLSSPQLFPMMTLPGIGSIPPLPSSLVGVGVALVSGSF